MPDQASGGLSFLSWEYLPVVAHQVHWLRVEHWLTSSLRDIQVHRLKSNHYGSRQSHPAGRYIPLGNRPLLIDIGWYFDSEPLVGSCRIISCCWLSSKHISGVSRPYLRNGQETCIQMHLIDASSRATFRASWILGGHITLTAALHPAKCGGGVKSNYLTMSYLQTPGNIYRIPYSNGAHCLLRIVRNEEKVSFVITAITTIVRHCGCVSYFCARVSEQLIMKVDHIITKNGSVSYLAVCSRNDHYELTGWLNGCFVMNPWPECRSWGKHCV
jgi:hypothetical protein